jgi:hypothetical protein
MAKTEHSAARLPPWPKKLGEVQVPMAPLLRLVARQKERKCNDKPMLDWWLNGNIYR